MGVSRGSFTAPSLVSNFLQEEGELFIMLLNLAKFVEIFCGDLEISYVQLAEPIDARDIRFVPNLATPLLHASNNSSNVLPVSLIIRFNRSFRTDGSNLRGVTPSLFGNCSSTYHCLQQQSGQ